MSEIVRPTKKQQELLTYIDNFINQHGYSPSYREVKSGMGYTSIATVSLHINNLIKRGHLQKRDRSARSLEVIHNAKITSDTPNIEPKQLKASEEKWLVRKVEKFFSDAETSKAVSEREMDQLYVLIGALKVLGLDGAAQSFIGRLTELKKKRSNNKYVV